VANRHSSGYFCHSYDPLHDLEQFASVSRCPKSFVVDALTGG